MNGHIIKNRHTGEYLNISIPGFDGIGYEMRLDFCNAIYETLGQAIAVASDLPDDIITQEDVEIIPARIIELRELSITKQEIIVKVMNDFSSFVNSGLEDEGDKEGLINTFILTKVGEILYDLKEIREGKK